MWLGASASLSPLSSTRIPTHTPFFFSSDSVHVSEFHASSSEYLGRDKKTLAVWMVVCQFSPLMRKHRRTPRPHTSIPDLRKASSPLIVGHTLAGGMEGIPKTTTQTHSHFRVCLVFVLLRGLRVPSLFVNDSPSMHLVLVQLATSKQAFADSLVDNSLPLSHSSSTSQTDGIALHYSALSFPDMFVTIDKADLKAGLVTSEETMFNRWCVVKCGQIAPTSRILVIPTSTVDIAKNSIDLSTLVALPSPSEANSRDVVILELLAPIVASFRSRESLFLYTHRILNMDALPKVMRIATMMNSTFGEDTVASDLVLRLVGLFDRQCLVAPLWLSDGMADSLGRDTDESSANFVQSIGVLISTPSQVIIKASMEMLEHLIFDVPPKVQISLVKANLIPQLITTLNPQSLSFTESADIHTYLVGFIARTVKLATQFNLNQLTIEDAYEPQSVPETVLKQVLVPSGPYIWHLCVNRLSIIDGHPSERFLELLAHLLQISPYYQPTMDFVLHMRVLLTIPSCLTIFESESSNWAFLGVAIGALWIWKIKSGEVRQRWKTMYQMLRMEGFDDVIDEKLRNDKNAHFGSWIVATSIQWNNLVGMNIPQRR
ncbi:hypothetical protein BLNAU_12063 [Blattamonas nauphoetae]|uniref:Uncharacterized protein n=1 Tax=Blattamonas nauphoetae TaxID=2049346 RepID=A0ABQ9XMT3_9EUKA|nr:hypothetical protein BLNAU_12063 [Blattamonas nauphoetae]